MKNKVFVAQTRVFLEREFLSKKGKGRNLELKEVQEEQINELDVEHTSQIVEENSTDLETKPLRRSTRECRVLERHRFLIITPCDIILVDQDEPCIYKKTSGSVVSFLILVAVKIILKYLRRTKDTFLVYGGEEELSIKGYTDASFQTNKDNLRSQSGFVFCLNGDAVSRKSSKQNTIADSTIEADYIAASEAAKVVVWTKKFINELRVISSISDAVELRCDKNATIAQAKEPISHQRSKHTLRRFHLI
ncbi:hypothetical protein V6N13_001490 [Hibiscus sabdariffa]